MLINSDGNLVVAGSKWDGATNFYFGIYDTTNFQVIADTMHARWDCMNPENVFYDLVAHPDSGYLVCGRISQCGGNRPVIYWFNNQAQLIGEFNGDYWGNSNDGDRPIFEDLIIRSDDHVLATYRYTAKAVNSDSIITTILMEFDKGLNLITTDTIGRAHTVRMQYEKEVEKLIFYGVKFTGNGPMNSHPHYSILDAFTFQSELKLAFLNESGSAVKTILKDSLWYLGYQTAPFFNTVKILKYDVLSNTVIDSIIFFQDSVNFSIPEDALSLVNDQLIVFGYRHDYSNNTTDTQQNHIWAFNSNLEFILDSAIHDVNVYPLNVIYYLNHSYFLLYQKYYLANPDVYVLKKADVLLISSIKKPNQKTLFKTYPNPTKEKLYFDIPIGYRNETLRYKIFSISGVLLRTGTLKQSLNISIIPKGLYILTISNSNQILFTTKISKL